jgi:glycine cleavage system H protein
MSQVYFTDEHEWISVEGDLGTVGITDFAQKALGDIVYVELPHLGSTVAKGGEGAVVESVKAASEVYSPATGEVTAINAAIEERPGLVNESPEQRGWFYQIRLSNPDELKGLKDRSAYDAFIAALE